MKNIKKLCLACFLLAGLCCAANSCYAQLGWHWAIGETSYGAPGTTGTELYSVASDAGSGVYVSGIIGGDSTKFGSITVASTAREYQGFIAKADSSGHYQWVIQGQNSGTYNVDWSRVFCDGFGNIYYYSSFDSNSVTLDTVTVTSPSGGFFLAKITPAGHVLWARVLPCGSGDMGVDNAGNIYVSGYYSGTVTIGTTTLPGASWQYYFFIAKYDPAGNFIWAEKFDDNGSMNTFYDAMAVSPDGAIYVYGDYGRSTPPAASINVGGISLTGVLFSTGYSGGRYMAKLDSAGHVIWAHNLPFVYTLFSMTCDGQDHLYATGSLDSSAVLGGATLTNAGDKDILLAEFDSSGAISWATSAGGAGSDFGFSISRDCNGNLWTAGSMMNSMYESFRDTVFPYTINFGTGTLTLNSGFEPSFIAEYDASGHYLRSYAQHGGGDDFSGLAVDNHGNVYSAGDYMDTMIYAADTLLPLSNEALFIARNKYDVSPCLEILRTQLPEEQAPHEISIHPNPASDRLHISAPERISSLVIFNMVGQAVFTGTYTDAEATVNVANIPAGVYFLRVNGTVAKRFVKD